MRRKKPVSEQVVVVTGASSGLGRAIARAAAERGAKVVVTARNEEALSNAVSEIERAGSEGLSVPADCTEQDQVERVVAQAIERFGRIDTYVANAIVTVYAEAERLTPEELRRVMDVNFFGTVYGYWAALPHLRASKGTFLHISSALAYRGIPLQAAYCGAKHAIQGFMDSLRTELLHDRSHVHVTMVQMPALNTPQFRWVKTRLPRMPQPVPPIFQPEVAAEAIHWAANHRRRELYVGMPTVEAIVGDKVASGFADWYLARTGFDSQQTAEPDDHARPCNLWDPVPGDHGAHGVFDGRASARCPELWIGTHRGELSLAGALAAAAAVLMAARRTLRGGRRA
jgi:NAD(P)-dependent dehydrogenase (short-subunit alcohol dehydrogenase family)